jgi:hypothetical protein
MDGKAWSPSDSMFSARATNSMSAHSLFNTKTYILENLVNIHACNVLNMFGALFLDGKVIPISPSRDWGGKGCGE